MAFSTDIIRTGGAALEHYIPAVQTAQMKLLFIHGSGQGSWIWKKFLPYFASRGYDTWALNLRGHHLSAPVSDWAAVGAAEYLEDIDLAVEKTGSNVVLIGHSMSGLLVLKYAEEHRVAGLIISQSGPPASVLKKRGIVLQKPGPKKNRPVSDTAALPMQDRDAAMKILFDNGNVERESVDLVMENMGEESLRATREIMQLAVDPARITEPVYVLGFDSSKIGLSIPVDPGRVLAEEFSARGYAVIEPGGHCYMLEKNWEDFARQFEAWLHFR